MLCTEDLLDSDGIYYMMSYYALTGEELSRNNWLLILLPEALFSQPYINHPLSSWEELEEFFGVQIT